MNKNILSFLFLFLFILSVILFPAQDSLKPRDLPANHRDWLTKEVFYLITPVEKEIFLKLQTSRERDRFIEAFWKQRDPTMGTERNEFREEHYKRFNHANTRFISAGKEGWKTDRGKIYIILGPPLTNRIFNGSDVYYPCEAWSYQGIEEFGLPHAFNLLFYQKGRIGDYILYQPGMEGPWSLLSNYHGDMTNWYESYYVLDNIEPELASMSLSLIPGDNSAQFPSLSSALLIGNIDYAAVRKIKDQYARKFLLYKDVVQVEYTANYIASDSRVQVLQDEQGIAYIHFSIEPKNLSMSSYENSIYTNLEFSGMVTDKAGKSIFQFDKQIPLRFSREQFEQMKQRPFSYSDAFPLIPGEYMFSLLLKNSVSKEFTSFETNIKIPEKNTKPKISQLLLAFNAIRPASPKDSSSPFIVGGLQLYSQPGNSFTKQDNLHVHFQMADLDEDSYQNGSLIYTFYKEDKEFDSQTYPLSRFQGSLNIIETFQLEKYPPGYYKIRVSINDGNQNEILTQQEQFEVSPIAYIPRPWVMSGYLIESRGPRTGFILGSEYLNSGEIEKAFPLLEQAFRTEPNNGEFGILFAKVRFEQKRYQDVLNILETLPESVKDNYDLSMLIGGSYQALGDFTKAIDIFKQTLDMFGVNTNLLNTLGRCYSGAGNTTEALAALDKSLEIDPNQEEIKALVQEIKKNSSDK